MGAGSSLWRYEESAALVAKLREEYLEMKGHGSSDDEMLQRLKLVLAHNQQSTAEPMALPGSPSLALSVDGARPRKLTSSEEFYKKKEQQRRKSYGQPMYSVSRHSADADDVEEAMQIAQESTVDESPRTLTA
jgi:hypothetical protein